MRVKGQHNGGSVMRVSVTDEFVDDLAMPTMDAVKDADGEPGILEGCCFEGMIMLQSIKKPPNWRLNIILLCLI